MTAFAPPNRDRTIRGFKADLAAAGIDYRDDAGRVADFHSLRHTAGTLLAATGVHPKVAQSLMRHSDINLTMSRYNHVLIGQESDAVAGLPDLAAPPRDARDVNPCESTEKTVESGSETVCAGVAELADARDSKSRRTPAQVPETTTTYDTPPKALGALLGAFAAEIGPQAPDLAAVISAWPGLPEALKAGIVAMVKAAGETPAK